MPMEDKTTVTMPTEDKIMVMVTKAMAATEHTEVVPPRLTTSLPSLKIPPDF
jgi:hypothetical protein